MHLGAGDHVVAIATMFGDDDEDAADISYPLLDEPEDESDE